MVKIDLQKRDFVWIGLVVVLIGMGIVYAYGGSNPNVMGHSGSELAVNNVLCRAITGHNCGYDTDTNIDTNTNAVTICPNDQFLDGDGQCRTSAQIVAAGGGSGGISGDCYWTAYSCGAFECNAGYVVVGLDARTHNEDCYGSGDWDTESRRLKCCRLA
ncbi:hypothetical protein HNV12_00765 [Methanococcoides sp. SA1]|nr:hypothetical protein [Methanococcoides sp. SA1]